LIYNTQEELDAGLALWQERLALRDWTIRAILCNPRELTEANAQINVNLKTKSALIRVCKDIPYPDWDTTPMDHERYLVHEIVHILTEPFWPIKTDEDKDSLIGQMAEQGVDCIAKSLVAAWRQDVTACRVPLGVGEKQSAIETFAEGLKDCLDAGVISPKSAVDVMANRLKGPLTADQFRQILASGVVNL